MQFLHFFRHFCTFFRIFGFFLRKKSLFSHFFAALLRNFRKIRDFRRKIFSKPDQTKNLGYSIFFFFLKKGNTKKNFIKRKIVKTKYLKIDVKYFLDIEKRNFICAKISKNSKKRLKKQRKNGVIVHKNSRN
jgi:hypothetical protein